MAMGGLSVNGKRVRRGGHGGLPLHAAQHAVSRGLSDAGLSLTASLKTGTTATLAYAWPLTFRNLDQRAQDALNRANLYFNLSQSF